MGGRGDTSSVLRRRADIVLSSVGLDYRDFEPERITWDYEGLMDRVGLDLQEVATLQREMFIGATPLAELENITELARSLAPTGRGARICLKDEATNPTGSFKDRRAFLPVRTAREGGFEGVIAATSGNYGAAVASQAARRGLKALIIQEVYDSGLRGQPESLEKGRACESYGAEVRQYTVGPEVFTRVILELLEETGFLGASLYLPHSIAGIETLGWEIAEDIRKRCGRDPDAVLVTHAGGGNLTGTARGLSKAGCGAEIVAVSVDLGDIDLHDDSTFSRKTFTTGHTGYGFPSLYAPDSVDVPLNAARPLRHVDRYFTVTQGEVFYTTEMLAQLEGLSRGPAGNTSLAAAFCLAQEMDRDQVIIVQESEYTGAGKSHTAQLSFAEENGVRIEEGDPRGEVPGESIIIPSHPAQMHVGEVDLGAFRRSYLEHNVVGAGFDRVNEDELAFLAEEINASTDSTRSLLCSLGVNIRDRE